MKKLIAILLVAVMVMSLAACGAVNKTDVAILWSDEGVVKIPNSLINAVERAMYNVNITYIHYGAGGIQSTQTKQAEAALEAGCSALLVNLVDTSAAQAIVDLAKAKDVPVVFFGNEVDAAIVSGYAKCAQVNTDAASVPEVQGTMIGEYLVERLEKENKDEKAKNKLDRNNDGVITYVAFGSNEAVAYADELLAEAELPALKFYDEANAAAVLPSKSAGYQMAEILAAYNDEAKNTVELIITDSDLVALACLKALVAEGFNSTKLTTHCIPVFAVGTHTDARSFTDTSTMTEAEKAELIYTISDLIGGGRATGTAVEDYDAIAKNVAEITRSLLKGEAVAETGVAVPYSTYTG